MSDQSPAEIMTAQMAIGENIKLKQDLQNAQVLLRRMMAQRNYARDEASILRAYLSDIQNYWPFRFYPSYLKRVVRQLSGKLS